MFELKQIKELMAAMGRHGTKRIEIRKEGFELVLEKESNESEKTSHFPPPPEFTTHYRHPVPFSPSGEIPPTQHSPTEKHAPAKEAVGEAIPSPMVGTFYTSSSPDTPPFVKVGDAVREDTVVCIVEAMKVMNEVKAGVAGIICEICVSNGDPVEFGTPLFRIQ